MSMRGDAATGSVVLVGDYNWRRGPFRRALGAYLFGRRERFVHLGMRCTVAWWRDQPYLISMREA